MTDTTAVNKPETKTASKISGIQCLILWAVALFFAYCLVYRNDAPPIELSMRTGTLSDYVLRAQNTSSDRLTLDVCIYEGSYSSLCSPVILDSGATAEFGAMEFKPSWHPKVGNKGVISVRGYQGKYAFSINEGGYLSYELIGTLPADFPSCRR